MNSLTKEEGIGNAIRFTWSFQFWRMALLWTLSLLYSYLRLFSLSLYSNSKSKSKSKWTRKRPHVYPCRSLPLSPKPHTPPICLVTGATSGLGAAAALALSKEGFYVILVGRSSQLLAQTMEGIRKQNPDARLKAFEVDLSSFESILKIKGVLEKWLLDSDLHCSIQILINNAGVLATSARQTTEGYDQMMCTNYIGAFSLTKIFLPLLRNSPVGSRIVNVTSFTHRSVFDVQVDKETVAGMCFLRAKTYPYAFVYEYSKLCLLLFSYQLHQELQMMDNSSSVSVNAADPGVVETNIMREIPSSLSHLAFTVLKLLGLLQSPEIGISSILDAALAPQEASGLYFFGGKGRTINSSALSYDNRLAEKLWKVSSDLFLESKLASDNLEMKTWSN